MPRERANGEGTLYFETKRDRWVGAITIDGRRRKVVAHTMTEARKRLDAMRAANDRGEQTGDGNVTVASVLDRWETRVLAGRDLEPATRDVYRWCCDVIRDELGPRRLRALTVDDVEAMLDRLSSRRSGSRPLSRASLVKVRSVLGQVLQFAERRGLAVKNVARIAELTPAAARARPRKSLEPAQAQQLFAALLEERLGPMFTLMLATGLRPGEAAGLMWTDVNLKRHIISVNHAARSERGKTVITDELKTRGSRRTIAVPEIVAEQLRRHRNTQNTERLGARSWADSRLVFATRAGTPLSAANVRRELKRICTQAKVPVMLPNELRHSAASIMSDAGVPLEQIADLLGHENTRMLDQTYRHRLRPSITAGVATMETLLATQS